MKRLISIILLLSATLAFGSDQRIQYSERMVGANHPTLSDSLNRLSQVEHDTDGTHKYIGTNIKVLKTGSGLNAEVAAVGSTPMTFLIVGEATLSGNVTIPSTLSIVMEYPGKITKVSGTLAINGPFSCGLHQCFSGFSAGDVTFGVNSTGYISVAWFGAKADNSTDDYAAITTAIAALGTTQGTVQLMHGKHLIKSKLSFNKQYATLKGHGYSTFNNEYGATTLVKDSAMTTDLIEMTGYGSGIENLTLLGIAGNTGNGLVVLNGRVRMKNIMSTKMGGGGIRIGDAIGTNCNLWYAENIYTKGNGSHGFHVEGDAIPDVNGGDLIHLDSQSNTGDGLYSKNAWLNTFTGLVTQNNTGWGVHFDTGSQMNTVLGGDINESNVAGQLFLEAGSVDNAILHAQIHESSFTDSGEGNIILHRMSSNIGGVLRGLNRVGFYRGGANYIIAQATNGYLSLIMNGDSPSDANARIKFPAEQPTSGNTAIVIMYHNGTAITVQTVSVGGVDSGGSGYKLLRVPN